jgi:hypothetical protein
MAEVKHKKPKLEKIVSTKISLDDFRTLNVRAKALYNQDVIKLPTVSHLLRWLIMGWCSDQRDRQFKNLQSRMP